MNMQINHATKMRIVKNFIFFFTHGPALDLELIESEGDSMDWDTHKEAIVITVAERKGTDNVFARPEEVITIFKDKIVHVTRKEYELMERTPEQEILLRQTMQEMASKAVN